METKLPRPIAAMTLNLTAELHKVEAARKGLQIDQSLSTRQSLSINKAIELLNESKRGGRPDRCHSRDLLLEIYKRFDIDVLLLCSIALSITKLGEIRRNVSQFFCELNKWRTSVQIAREIHELATNLFTAVLSQIGVQKGQENQVPEPEPVRNDGKGKRKSPVKKNPPVKRRRVSLSEESQEPIPGCNEWSLQQPTPNEGSVDVNHEPKTEGDRPVKEESQTPPATNNTTDNTAGKDVPLYATVVKLQTMDVIRSLVLQGCPEGRLTIPDMEGSTPFITIQCPTSLALSFKANREQIKW